MTKHIAAGDADAPPMKEIMEWYTTGPEALIVYGLRLAPSGPEGRVIWIIKAWRLSKDHEWAYEAAPVDFVPMPDKETDRRQASLIASLRSSFMTDVAQTLVGLTLRHAEVPATFRRTEGFLQDGPPNPGEENTRHPVPY